MANMANRFFAINTEATYATPIVSALKYGEVDDESFAPNFDIMTRSDISRYGPRKTVIGMETSGGDVSWAMLGDEFTNKLIANTWNKGTTTGSSAPYTHTLEEDSATSDQKAAVANNIYKGTNSLTVVVGREGRTHRYKGQSLNSLTISANVGEYVMCSASFLGCGEAVDSAGGTNEFIVADGATGGAPADTVFHDNDAFHFEGAHIAFEGGAETANDRSGLVKSVELTFNLNRDTDSAVALGNNSYTRAPVPGMREITGSIEFNRAMNAADVADDEPFFKELAAGLTVVGTATAPALSVQYNGATNEALLIDIYSLQYDAPDSTISGRDRQTLKVSFTALYNEATSCMSKAIITSTKSASPFA